MENKINPEEPFLKKIPLNDLINLLVNLYNRGVDYIDIGGTQGDNKDLMSISFTNDYIAENAKEEFDKMEDIQIDTEYFKTKLTDEDLNQLI